jgi:hypothetical protein
MTHSRHPKNAPGPFYVVRDACIFCTAPEHEAPGLMDHVDKPFYHCYFKKQPMTPAEIDRAVMAVGVSCCGAVRYAGEDAEVLNRLQALGRASSCDPPTE